MLQIFLSLTIIFFKNWNPSVSKVQAFIHTKQKNQELIIYLFINYNFSKILLCAEFMLA